MSGIPSTKFKKMDPATRASYFEALARVLGRALGQDSFVNTILTPENTHLRISYGGKAFQLGYHTGPWKLYEVRNNRLRGDQTIGTELDISTVIDGILSQIKKDLPTKAVPKQGMNVKAPLPQTKEAPVTTKPSATVNTNGRLGKFDKLVQNNGLSEDIAKRLAVRVRNNPSDPEVSAIQLLVQAQPDIDLSTVKQVNPLRMETYLGGLTLDTSDYGWPEITINDPKNWGGTPAAEFTTMGKAVAAFKNEYLSLLKRKYPNMDSAIEGFRALYLDAGTRYPNPKQEYYLPSDPSDWSNLDYEIDGMTAKDLPDAKPAIRDTYVKHISSTLSRLLGDLAVVEAGPNYGWVIEIEDAVYKLKRIGSTWILQTPSDEIDLGPKLNPYRVKDKILK